jgi:hypothetical protein
MSDDLFNRIRDALLENGFAQQDDYLLAHGASVMSGSSHEIIHVDTLRTILASAGQAQPQPIATLHDDGHWTWKPGMRMYECNQAGWWMDVYAAPPPAVAQTIGGSHESAGTKPIGTVTVSTMEQGERGALPEWFDAFLTNVCEMPDRNSPDDEPDAIVATLQELRACALNAIEARAAASPVSGAARDVWKLRAALQLARDTLIDNNMSVPRVLEKIDEALECPGCGDSKPCVCACALPEIECIDRAGGKA